MRVFEALVQALHDVLNTDSEVELVAYCMERSKDEQDENSAPASHWVET